MMIYDCYVFDGDARFTELKTRDVPDEAEAIRWADRLFSEQPHYKIVELWRDDSLVHRRQR